MLTIVRSEGLNDNDLNRKRLIDSGGGGLTSSVWPSAGDRATCSAPTLPEAPTRFSTTIVCKPVAFGDDAAPMAAITIKGRQLIKVSDFVLEEARSIAKSIAIAE